jgi:hypothetical protein
MTDVVVVSWPSQRDEVERLARMNTPRLLLVEAGSAPPISFDPLEDWIMQPLDEFEYHARLARLRGLAGSMFARPTLDGHRRLLYRDRWVALSEQQELLVTFLISAPRQGITQEALLEAGWPTSRPVSNTFRVAMRRLRERLGQVGLDLRRTRDGHWLIEATSFA